MKVKLYISGCSISYNLSLYPQLSDINSQVNEQANAGLKRIKAQLSYMTANNFMNHCSLYSWYKNMKIKEQHDNIFDTVWIGFYWLFVNIGSIADHGCGRNNDVSMLIFWWNESNHCIGIENYRLKWKNSDHGNCMYFKIYTLYQ